VYEDMNHQGTIVFVLSLMKFPDYFLLPPAAMEAIGTQCVNGPFTRWACCPKKRLDIVNERVGSNQGANIWLLCKHATPEQIIQSK